MIQIRLLKKVAANVCALAMMVSLVPLSADVTADAASKKIALSAKSKSLEVNGKFTLKLKNAKKTVKWSSNKPKVAKISKKKGVSTVVTGLKKGTAKITAKYAKKKYTCTVKVKEPALEFTSSAGDVIQVTDKWGIQVSGALGDVTVKSSDDTLVSIEPYGSGDEFMLTALKEGGPVKVTASCGTQKEASFTIEKIVSRGLYIETYDEHHNSTSQDLYLNPTQLWHYSSVTYVARNDFDPVTVTWESTDPTVAEVKDGVVTAKSPGYATIIAKDSAGNIAGSMVSVYESEENTSITKGLSFTDQDPIRDVDVVNSAAVDLSICESIVMLWGVYADGQEISIKDIKWESDAPSVFSVTTEDDGSIDINYLSKGHGWLIGTYTKADGTVLTFKRLVIVN